MENSNIPRVVTFGEVMARLSSPGYQMLTQASSLEVGFAGSEANVAVSLANYGIDAAYFTALPQNPIADHCIRELRGYQVDVSHILRGGDRMGIMYQETGSNSRPSRVFYDRAGSSIATLDPDSVDWHTILDSAQWLHWSGITPALSPAAARLTTAALTAARQLGLIISCDINYRNNLWQYGAPAQEVMLPLLQQCHIVIGNEEDCARILGIAPQHFDADRTGGQLDPMRFQPVCSQVLQLLPQATHVALSLRGAVNANHNTWTAVLHDRNTFYTAPTYDITDIVDRIGAGDSFSAALIYGILALPSADQALRFATAASCLKHTIHGDFNLVTTQDVQRLLGGNASGRIVR